MTTIRPAPGPSGLGGDGSGHTVPAAGLRAQAAAHPVGVVWLGVMLFSLGPVLVAGSSVSGVAFSFWRLWAGVAILGVIVLVRRWRGARPPRREGYWWAIGSGLAFGAHQLLFMISLHMTSVVDVTLMNTLAPIIVGVLAIPAFGERPGTRFRLWSVMAMVGAAGVAIAGGSGPSGNALGMALAATNVVFYSLYFVGSKQALPHIEPLAFLFWAVAAAAVMVTTYAAVFREQLTPIGASDILAVLAVALVAGVLGHFSITWALQWVPANLPPVIMLSLPVISGAAAWLLLDQAVTWLQAAAGAWTLVAVAGAVRSPTTRVRMDEALVLAEEP